MENSTKGQAYIKTYALSLLSDGATTPVEALRLAREAWIKRQENERIINSLLQEG